jgi:hypothetical protein
VKAYRKFKLPEAARPPAKVANPAKVPGPGLETLATLATLAAGKAAPDPDEVEIEERKTMAMGGVPEAYLDGWARLQIQKPLTVSDAQWRQAIDDAGRFFDQWSKLVTEFQWTPTHLFDVPRDEAMGLIWWLQGRTVTALGPKHACCGMPAYDRVTGQGWVNPYSRPVRRVSLSPMLER